MNLNTTIKDTTDLAKDMWNSMTLPARLVTLPMLVVLLPGGILTGIIVFSLSSILSAYARVIE